MVAPAVGDISIKTYLMAMPFIKSIHNINIMLLPPNVFLTPSSVLPFPRTQVGNAVGQR